MGRGAEPCWFLYQWSYFRTLGDVGDIGDLGRDIDLLGRGRAGREVEGCPETPRHVHVLPSWPT